MGPLDGEDRLAEQVSRARPLEVILACGPSRILPPAAMERECICSDTHSEPQCTKRFKLGTK